MVFDGDCLFALTLIVHLSIMLFHETQYSEIALANLRVDNQKNDLPFWQFIEKVPLSSPWGSPIPGCASGLNSLRVVDNLWIEQLESG
jgi:hypothetical protein